jgi:hypothetical protein
LLIAPDDHRDRPPSLVEAPIEPIGDRAHMRVETSLCRQAGGKKRKNGEAERAEGLEQPRRGARNERDRRKIEDERPSR